MDRTLFVRSPISERCESGSPWYVRCVASAAPSIVSLIPSATEIVCALGLRPRLVGVSHECDFPEDVRGLPVLSAPKLDPGRPSAEIDRAVRGLLETALSVYRIDLEGLARLRPELIVTQSQCEVCAVPLSDVDSACAQLGLESTRVCSRSPTGLDEVLEDFRRVAQAAGVAARGEELVSAVTSRFDAIRASASGRRKPRVALVEWLDPPMIAGGWMPELLRIAGGEPVIVQEPRRFATVTWDDIVAADPELVVLLPCGFDVERTLRELRTPEIAEPLRRLSATRHGRTFVVDGNAYFNRPGPRLAESAELLARVVAGRNEPQARVWH
jgi:iron complex transport system substrate-binding protein